MDRRSGACKIVDFIDFHIEREGYVMPQDFETVIIQQRFDIPFAAGEKVVRANDIMAVVQEPFAEM
jgi:hypothetical protein